LSLLYTMSFFPFRVGIPPGWSPLNSARGKVASPKCGIRVVILLRLS
jgi:hypothetical protein